MRWWKCLPKWHPHADSRRSATQSTGRQSNRLFRDVAPRPGRIGAPPDREEWETRRLSGDRCIRVNHPDGDAEVAARGDDHLVGGPGERAAARRLTGRHEAGDVLRADHQTRVRRTAQVHGIGAAEPRECRSKATRLGRVRERALSVIEAVAVARDCRRVCRRRHELHRQRRLHLRQRRRRVAGARACTPQPAIPRHI